MRRILVYEHLSGAGSHAQAPGDEGLLAMGQAMRDAVADDLIRLEDYEVSVATRDPALPVPAAATPVTPQPGESARDFVARQGDAHHLVWVVAPETDGTLSDLQRSIDPARWVGCDGPAITLASSKRATLMRLAAAGVTTPLAFEHAPETTRWVVKPDDGAGALATRLHRDSEAALADWSQRSRTDGPMAIEPWVDGEALSLSLLCRKGRSELLSINRQRVDIDAEGVLSFRGVDVNVLPLAAARTAPSRRAEPKVAALRALATRVGRAVTGLCGFVGVDLVWHPQRGPVVIEINPRVTCAYVGLSRALGRNLAAEVIAAPGPGAAHGRA